MIKDFIKRYEVPIVIALIILGALLRLVWLGSLPLGLNQDEASAGYDAWAILNYGMDRNGNTFPVLLESWGSGQNALYSYLSMPFIAIWGLSVWSLRLVGALLGVAGLVVFWLMARRCRGAFFGAAALLFLAVNPWHIMASRWALESNLLPFFLLLGIYLISLSADKPWALVGAAASLALSLYAYGTAFFFLPPFLIFSLLWLWKRRAVRPGSFFTALGAFIVLALPIALCQLMNALYPGEELTILGCTLPALTEGRQLATSVFGGGGLTAAFDNFRGFLRILFTQSDGLPFNATEYWGIYYVFGLPLMILGVYSAVKERGRFPGELLMLAALGISFLCAFLIDVNINRINMAWIPVMYFCSLGFYFILCKLNSFDFSPCAVIVICCAMFFSSYVLEFKTNGYSGYFPGLGEAILYAEALDAETVFITHYVNQPYIFILFYTQPPPQEFMEAADYINPEGAFRFLYSFGKYSFGSAESAHADILILHESETYGHSVLAEFGQYAVCK